MHSASIHVEDCEAVYEGICSVVAVLPEVERWKLVERTLSPGINRLESASRAAQGVSARNLSPILSQVAAEIRILSTFVRSFATARGGDSDAMESGCDTSPDGRTPLPEPILEAVRSAWPFVARATSWANNEVRTCF